MLELHIWKAGVSLAGPFSPKGKLHPLPATLRIQTHNSMPSCSKASGVFPSWCGYGASLPQLHFHRAGGRDSSPVVTLFMRFRTYLKRNCATFGRLWLPPSFTGASRSRKITLAFNLPAPDKRRPLYSAFWLSRELCF